MKRLSIFLQWNIIDTCTAQCDFLQGHAHA